MWQEIITYIIIAIATILAARKLYMKFKKPSGCDSCSTDSCAACGLADLKKDIDAKKQPSKPHISTKIYHHSS